MRRIGKSRRSLVGGSWGRRRCLRAARNCSDWSRPCARPAGRPWRPEPGRAEPARAVFINVIQALQPSVPARTEDRIAAGSSLGAILKRHPEFGHALHRIERELGHFPPRGHGERQLGRHLVRIVGVKRQTGPLQGSFCRTGSKEVERLRAEIAVAKELESHWCRTWPRR